MGRLKSDQGQLFYEFHLGEAVPEDHLVRRCRLLQQNRPEAEVIGAFGHGVESLPTTARGTLRAVLQCNRHLYALARQMSEISCQSHLEAAVSLNSSTLPHVLSVTAKTS